MMKWRVGSSGRTCPASANAARMMSANHARCAETARADGLVGIVELGGDLDEGAAPEPGRSQLVGDVPAERPQSRLRVLHRQGGRHALLDDVVCALQVGQNQVL